MIDPDDMSKGRNLSLAGNAHERKPLGQVRRNLVTSASRRSVFSLTRSASTVSE